MRLELHPEARAELRSAALWYDERRTGLGDEFIAEVSATLDRIGNAPESHPAWPRTPAAGPLIRKATIQRQQSSPDVVPQTRRILTAIVAGDFATVEKQFIDDMKTALPPGALAGMWAKVLNQAGCFEGGRSAAKQAALSRLPLNGRVAT